MDERNFAYMFYGFAAAWVILFAYLVLLVTRERELHREVETLRRLIGEREKN